MSCSRRRPARPPLNSPPKPSSAWDALWHVSTAWLSRRRSTSNSANSSRSSMTTTLAIAVTPSTNRRPRAANSLRRRELTARGRRLSRGEREHLRAPALGDAHYSARADGLPPDLLEPLDATTRPAHDERVRALALTQSEVEARRVLRGEARPGGDEPQL